MYIQYSFYLNATTPTSVVSPVKRVGASFSTPISSAKAAPGNKVLAIIPAPSMNVAAALATSFCLCAWRVVEATGWLLVHGANASICEQRRRAAAQHFLLKNTMLMRSTWCIDQQRRTIKWCWSKRSGMLMVGRKGRKIAHHFFLPTDVSGWDYFATGFASKMKLKVNN